MLGLLHLHKQLCSEHRELSARSLKRLSETLQLENKYCVSLGWKTKICNLSNFDSRYLFFCIHRCVVLPFMAPKAIVAS